MERGVTPDGGALARARSAYDDRDFDTAYSCFAEVHAHGGLEVEDLNRYADAAWWVGHLPECLTLTEAVHHELEAGGSTDRAALNALEIGFLWLLRGEEEVGAGWLHRARRLVEASGSAEPRGLLVYLETQQLLAAQELDAAAESAARLRDLAAGSGSRLLGTLAEVCAGVRLVRAGEVAAGLSLLDEAMLPVLAGQLEPQWAGSLYCGMIALCHELHDVRRARAWREMTERWCGQFSSAAMFLGICRLHEAQVLGIEGRWTHAEEAASRVAHDLADANREVVAEAEYQVGECHRLRGEAVAAHAAYERARAAGREPQPGAALLQAAEGDREGGWTTLAAALVAADPDPFWRMRLLRAGVNLALAAGHLAEAGRLEDELARMASRYDSPGFRAWAGQARGALLLARGEPAGAVGALEDACREHRRVGARYDAATTQLLLAEALSGTGDTAQAAACRQEALAVLADLGAVAGPVPGPVAGPDRQTGPRPGGLTEREVEVLTHVAAGLSNREVAVALFISEPTVRRHLANVFTKLGVHSRTAAAAWAHEQRLVPRLQG